MRIRFVVSILIMVCLAQGCATTRGPLAKLPDEDRHKFISEQASTLVTGGRVNDVHWAKDGTAVYFTRAGEPMMFDLVSRTLVRGVQPPEDEDAKPRERSERRRPARGAQRDRETSPDGKWVAVARDWNVILEPADADDAEESADDADSSRENDDAGESASENRESSIRITSDGSRKFRYGKASWVYGEELDQIDAMWWSPDSTKLAFYEFDEREVPDHFLTADLTELHTKVLTEGYPKAGEPNPIANILIYDLNSHETIRVDVGDQGAEQYIYNVRFSPNGDELLFYRTNRHQNVLEFMAADPSNGRSRVILTETQECWQENSPEIRFLEDGRRFIWATEKTGWKQYELWDLDGTHIATLTRGEYPANAIIHVDEDRGVMYYTAYSSANPLNAQLHRVNLDGTDQRRLTQEPLNHTPRISPDGKWFITTYEAVNVPPTTALYDTEGTRIWTLATSDLSRFKELGLEMPELFTFKAADGVTDLYGVLYKPSNFNPRKKYPLLIDVYGGPLSRGVQNRFSPANAATEYGFLIAKLENRGTVGRGKAFETATYLKLGEVDLADQVAGVKYLTQRPYVDASRVGIFGHSYGGYMSALALLKYPDVFRAAVAGGTVTDWRNYDTIYTERFMRTPQENPEGYDNGSCLTYVKNLKGNLLLQHGMVDDNVHPNNAWQLVEALHKANLRFEMQMYPNAGHGIGPPAAAIRWEFFRRHLLN